MTLSERLREDADTVQGALVAHTMRHAADRLEALEKVVQSIAKGVVMNITLDKNHLDQVETNIAPPMRRAITIPVMINGAPSDVMIYVCVSAWPAFEMGTTLRDVAERLTLKDDHV